ncbi:MAG TPA: plastocyanin/azurin family copper-binding protein [bacterium]|nr:plastocyanin/azurin family copper-binding protein [bacterium]
MRFISGTLVVVALVLAVSGATAAVQNVTVAPGGSFSFSPAAVTVAIGDTVHWVWEGGQHNVASGVPGSPTPYFHSGLPSGAGTTFDVVFDVTFLGTNPAPGGVYDYFCEPHGNFGMVGSVTVDGATGAASDQASWGKIKALFR